MPASWLRRRRLGRRGLSVIGGVVFVGWDVVELAVQSAVVDQSTHSIVVYSTSSMVRSGPARNGLRRPTAAVLINPNRRLRSGVVIGLPMLPIDAAIPSSTRASAKAIDVYCDPA